MDSILTSIKQLLGITEEYTAFDPNIIMLINDAFFQLRQLGVHEEPFVIEDKSTTWDEYIEEGEMESVKTYIYLYTKLIFDPPTNSALLNAMKEKKLEYEWRFNVEVDPPNEEE